ncbi:MAG: hypothetical protein ABI564_15035 [Ideonella sp.]
MSNSRRKPMQPAARCGAPERWTIDAGDAALASLQVPPDAVRERRFEISCSMTVQRINEAAVAWHRLTVLADGLQQWQRRVDTHAGVDGLDYRFERMVAPGQALRINAEVTCSGAVKRSLQIEVDEVLD